MTEPIELLCDKLDRQLSQKAVLPEDAGARLKLLRPLEEAVVPLPEAPTLPDTTAGILARSLWYKHHPKQADLNVLLSLLQNSNPLVRSTATDALADTLQLNDHWSKVGFVTAARQILQQTRALERSPIITYQITELLDRLPNSIRSRKRPTPKITFNPYVAGLPILKSEDFFGRKRELQAIEKILLHESGVKSIVLYGARRSGKTSILYRLRDGALGDSFLPVYLDMQALAGTELIDFLRALITETREAVCERRPDLTNEIGLPMKEEVNFPILQQFFKIVSRLLEGMSLVLLMDEYEVLEQFFKNGNLAKQFQSLLEHEERLFVIFAGSRKLEALKNQYFLFLLDASKDLRISFLENDDAVALITRPTTGQLDFDTEIIHHLLKLTGAHPFYTQLTCQLIFDLSGGKGKVTWGNLDDAVHKFIQNPPPHLILTWNALSMEQRVVASAAADEGAETLHSPPSLIAKLRKARHPLRIRPGEVEQELNSLEQIDWMQKDFGRGTYRFTMELVRQWIQENHSLATLAEEYRDEVVSKAASFWRQRLAWLADLLLLGAMGGSVALIKANLNWSEGLAWSVYALLSVLYLGLPIPFADSTLGLRLAHLRIVDVSARALGRFRATLYGIMLIARFWFLMAALRSLIQGNRLGWNSLLIVFIVLIVSDNCFLLFSKTRQGLYDKVMRTVIVPAKAVRE